MKKIHLLLFILVLSLAACNSESNNSMKTTENTNEIFNSTNESLGLNNDIATNNAPVSEEEVKEYINNTFDSAPDSVEILKHNTDLNNNTDSFVVDVRNKYTMYDDITNIHIVYKCKSGKWEIDSFDESFSREFHLNGIYGQYIKFLECNDNGQVNVASYKIGIKDSDYSKNGYSINYKTYQISSAERGDFGIELETLKELNKVESFDYLYDDEYFYLSNGTTLLAFDKNNIYNTGYRDGKLIIMGTKPWDDCSESELEDTLSRFTFIYGLYAEDYRGDASSAITVPDDVVGMNVDEVISYLQGIGFGNIEKYYGSPETVQDVYTYDLESDSFSGEPGSFINRKFDKGSWLCVFNHDD